MATGLGIIGQTSVAPQAQQKINLYVNPHILKFRRDRARTVDPTTHGIIDPQSINRAGLTIFNDEIAVIKLADQRPGNRSQTHNVHGFTSFAGEVYDKRMSQEAFDRQYLPIGFATTKFDPEGDIPSEDGISVRKKGSGSVFNSSDKVIFPGDVLRAVFPRIDERARAKQYKILYNADIPGTQSPYPKPVATIEKVTYSETMESFAHIAKHLVVNNKNISVPAFRSKIEKSPNTDDIEEVRQMATVQKMVHGVTGMSYVTSLIKRGFLVPTCPSGAVPLDTEGNTDLASWLERASPLAVEDTNAINKYQWVAGPSSDAEIGILVDAIRGASRQGGIDAFKLAAQGWSGRFVGVGGTQVAQRTLALEHQIGTLAVLTGVASSTGKTLKEDVIVTTTANIRIMFGALGKLDNYEMLRAEFFKTVSLPQVSRVNGLGTVVNDQKTPLAQLHTAYMEAYRIGCRLFSRYHDDKFRTVIALATSTSSPGELVNYVA